jgi:uncharacterized repeat protein (TIGR03803 family)
MSTNANRLAAVREYGAIFRAEPIQRSMLGLALFTAFLAASPVYAQVRYEVVSPFSYATNGAAPYAPLVQARDGNFYGTAYDGGPSGYGIVFRIDSAGTLTTLYSFSNSSGSGQHPYGGLIEATDGFLYGTTVYGGTRGYGTVFRIDLSGNLTILHSFQGDDGMAPYAGLIQGTDGNFYGTTERGYSYGTVFKMDSVGNITILHRFGVTDGAYPRARLIQAVDGRLYGTTSVAGSAGGGTVFRVDSLGGSFAILRNFTSATGGNPYSELVQSTDGNFYGTTSQGGGSGYGTVFRLDLAGNLTVLRSFTYGNGANPYAALAQGTDGSLYGTTTSGGSSGRGTIFKIDTVGNLTTLSNFGGTDGARPYSALAKSVDGKFYGTTAQGGESDFGTVFRIDPTGAFSTIRAFVGPRRGRYAFGDLIETNDGSLYGTTIDTLGSGNGLGASGFGTVFRVDTEHTLSAVANFNGVNGAYPYAGLVQGSDGYLYGTTQDGGASGYGAVFKVDTAGNLTSIRSFDNSNGAHPRVALTKGSDGYMYGTTIDGGVHGYGTLFKLDTVGNLTTLHAFNFTDGATPCFRLTLGNDGYFYGMTTRGGTSGFGTVFKVDAVGNLTTIFNFVESAWSGCASYGGLLQASDGKFYGATYWSGAGYGTVFTIDSTGSFRTVATFNRSNGSFPIGRLAEGTDGALYGTASGGGAFGYGTLFKVDGAGVITTLHDFNGSDGAYPSAGLIQGSDGGFSGATVRGGPYDTGVVFRIRYNQVPVAVGDSFSLDQNSTLTIPAPGVLSNDTDTDGDALTVTVVSGPSHGSVTLNADGSFTYIPATNYVGSDSFTYRASDGIATSNIATVSITVFATAPAVGLSPTTIAFGSQAIGIASSSQTVTVTNAGSAGLQITTVTLTGTNAGDFVLTADGCTNASVAPAASCSFGVAFAPTTTGNRVGNVAITDDAIDSPQSVTLTGTGVGAAVTLSATSLAFGSERVGTSSTTTSYATGATPNFIAVGSLGGTAIDLAVANLNSNNVSVLRGNGDGTFQPRVDYPVGSAPRSVAIGDVNGDGRSDLVIANQGSDSVSVLLGNGDGTFQTAVDYPAGSGAFSVAMSDINGDTVLDLVVADVSSSTVSVLRGNGNGTFQSPIGYTVGSLPRWVAMADLDGNGLPDAVVANAGSNTLSVLLNNGNGSFHSATAYPTQLFPFALAIADVNGDGRSDLVTANYNSHTLSIFRGNGNGTFQAATTLPTDLYPVSVAAADLNNDGRPDLVVANSVNGTDHVSLLFGNGDGTFQAPLKYTAGFALHTITIADVDGDGTRDVLVPHPNDDRLSVLLGRGNGILRASQQVTLTNTGAATLNINAIALTGTNARDFIESNSCGTSIPAGNDCQIVVTFAPISVGARTALLEITDDANGSPHAITLAGAGTMPAATLSASSLTFGLQGVGTASAPKTVTVTNTGTATLHFSALTVGGSNPAEFIVDANSCTGASVTVGAACSFNVKFVPTGTGGRSATLTLIDDAGDGPQIIQLSGSGVGPVVGLSASSLGFGNQVVETASAAQTVTLSNTGTIALNIAAVTVAGLNAGDFTLTTNSCTGASVAPNATCSFAVKFVPTTAGNRVASVGINDDAADSPQTVGLGGNGTTPAVGLSATTLAFGNQVVGTTSATTTVVVTNTGTATLHINTVTLDGSAPGDFVLSANSCTGALLLPASACSFDVKFAPQTTGSRNAVVSISDDAADSPQLMSLSGTGTTPRASFSASNLAFGNQLVSTASAAQTVTVSNTGTATLHIGTLTIGGSNPADFVLSANSCTGASVAAGTTCSFSVKFAPVTTGNRTATVTIADDAAGSPQAVAVNGTGTAPVVTLSANNIDFGNQTVGTTSAARSVTLTNSGTGALNIASRTITGTNATDFAFSPLSANTCTGSIAPGSSCSISLVFTPTNGGTRTAAVSIADNAANSPQVIALTGTGRIGSATLTPSLISFATTQTLNTTSAPVLATLKNTGTTSISIGNLSASAEFGIAPAPVTSCGSTLGGGASCSIGLTFTPTSPGTRAGQLTVVTGVGTLTAQLTGTGTIVSLLPTALSFGTVNVGTTSASQTATLKNVSSTAGVSISSIVISGNAGSDFAIASNTCGSSLGPGASCAVSIWFKPSRRGARSAALTVNDNADGSPHTVNLNGSGR